MTFGIINAYDIRNRGDRAIVEAQLGWIRRKHPDAKIFVFSPYFEENSKVFGSEISSQPVYDAPLNKGKIGKIIAPFWRHCIFHFFPSTRSEHMQRFMSCDAVIMCGGGYLYSSPAAVFSRQLWLHVCNALLAIRLKKPVLTFPQSWGPLRKKADRWICCRLAQKLEIICTRGAASSRLVEELGGWDKVNELPDVVMALGELRPKVLTGEVNKGKKSLGIAPIHWGFDRNVSEATFDEYIEKLARVAEIWSTEEQGSIRLIPQVVVDGHDDDRLPCVVLKNRLNEMGIEVDYDPDVEWDKHWELIRSQDVFIGCRMHACIFSLVSSVPAVGLAYQPKFHELYGQLGCAEYAHEIDQFKVEVVVQQLRDISENISERQRFHKGVRKLSDKLIEGMDQCWEKIKSVTHSS